MGNRQQRGPTRVGRNTAQASGRQTKYFPAGERHADRVHGARDNRRIVGVLVSYTWEPGGQLFEVREGDTHIGSGVIKADPAHRPVHVQCPQDAMLSGDHALILVQRGRYYIKDLSSTNGTTLNGTLLRPESQEDLPSPAEIKAGKTVFNFVKFDVAAGAAPPQERQPIEDKQDPKKTVLR